MRCGRRGTRDTSGHWKETPVNAEPANAWRAATSYEEWREQTDSRDGEHKDLREEDLYLRDDQILFKVKFKTSRLL